MEIVPDKTYIMALLKSSVGKVYLSNDIRSHIYTLFFVGGGDSPIKMYRELNLSSKPWVELLVPSTEYLVFRPETKIINVING